MKSPVVLLASLVLGVAGPCGRSNASGGECCGLLPPWNKNHDGGLRPASGHVLWENPDTDYETGTEFHVEWALVRHFSKTFTLGVTGYHYQQVTGDSGAGATLGDFEGRVTALGAVLTYSFALGKIPVSTQWTYFHEFDVENRVEGDAGLLTISMPLS